MAPLETLAKRANHEGFTFEVVKDRTGVRGLSLSFGSDHFFVLNDDREKFDLWVKDMFSHSYEKRCFDMRDIRLLGLDYKKYCDVIDVSIMSGEENLYKAVNTYVDDAAVSEYLEKRHAYKSHVKACRIAKIDLENNSLVDIVPSKVLVSFYRLRNKMVDMLCDRLDVETFRWIGYERARVLYSIEENGVKVDPEVVKPESVTEIKFIEHVKGKTVDGFVYNRFVPQRTKTGRVHTGRGSFQCMSIPKTHVRRCIVSRFDGGEIVSFDLNAADYRCIVDQVKNEHLHDVYDNCSDFHDRTVEYVFGGDPKHLDTRRPVMKMIVYTKLYGGSLSKLSRQTGLPNSTISLLLNKLEPLLTPIIEFRDELYDTSIADGFVSTSGGMSIELKGDEHPGKVLALWAQTHTNDVFMDCVVNVHDLLDDRESVILFTVHDELVIDVHPDERELVDDVKELMETSIMKVKVKSGPNYWDLT